MKKLLLSFVAVVVGSTAMSQYIFRVTAPASIASNYDFTGPDDGSSWGLTTLANVYVEDTIVFANDGTTGNNAQGNPAYAGGCNALAANSLAGKIAMVYRYDGVSSGNCSFGVKAQMCANAGAVAVIIVNREEAMINMDGGAEGLTVTVPVIFVTQSTGLAIKNQLLAGTTVKGIIGDKTGVFGDDLGALKEDVTRANAGIEPLIIAQSGTEFPVTPGSWVRNYGANDQTNVKLNAKIMMGSTTIYDQTSAAGQSLASGDSVFIQLPDFAPATYSAGTYTLNYMISSDATDADTADNKMSSNFTFDNKLWTLARANAYGDPMNDGGVRGVSATGAGLFFEACSVFRDSNASRMQVYGLTGEISVAAGKTPAGEEVQFKMYQWNDDFADLNDPNIATFADIMTDLQEVGSASIFLDNTQLLDTTLYAPFDGGAVALLDNQRYLFCVIVNEDSLYVGYDNKTDYEANINNLDAQPRYPVYVADASTGSGGTWFSGFLGGPVPAIGAVVSDPLGLAEAEITATAFPNPTKDIVTVKLNENGKGKLLVTDMAGRIVSTQALDITNGQFSTNLSGLTTGNYLFSVLFDNGKTSRFNVAVTK